MSSSGDSKSSGDNDASARGGTGAAGGKARHLSVLPSARAAEAARLARSAADDEGPALSSRSGEHARPSDAAAADAEPCFSVRELNAWFGAQHVLEDVSLDVNADEVTAVIGPSGCGKSTFIRCLNRLHELEPEARLSGEVRFAGQSIYAPDTDPALLRRRVGMIFARANPFPSMSIRDNVLAGRRLTGRLRRGEADEIVERALRAAGLWTEVDYRLGHSTAGLAGGQLQRLCIARALAMEPDVLLMDEPCAVLDPEGTARLEDLIYQLKADYTIVIATHNMQQAARVSSRTAFFLDGHLVEVESTDRLFTSPADPRTEDYLTGRFG